MNRKLKEEQHNYSFNILKQSETSKQKWNFMKNKIGNNNIGNNVSEFDKSGIRSLDKKIICDPLNQIFAEMGKNSYDFDSFYTQNLDHYSEKINKINLPSHLQVWQKETTESRICS